MSISSFKDIKYRKSPQNFTSGEIFKTSAIWEGVRFYETPRYPNRPSLSTLTLFLLFNDFYFKKYETKINIFINITNRFKLWLSFNLNELVF